MLTRKLRVNRHERGQVVVLFALLLPVILTFGSIVVSAGNWYVLKRHLQTQVDAAALAGGPAFSGCSTIPDTANYNISQQALTYAGDTLRLPSTGSTYNLQVENEGDQRAVINSSAYWPSNGIQTNGTGYDYSDVSTAADAPKKGAQGSPCYNGYLDVKSTDDKAPLLFRWIPLFPSLKSRAKVEVHEVAGTNGLRPLGVPEVDPKKVAVIFVNEDAPGGVNSSAAIVGKGFLSFWDPANPTPGCAPPAQLSGIAAWHTDSTCMAQPDVMANFNGNENYSAVILASRDPNASLTAGNGSLQAICSQNPTQTHCYGPGTNLQRGVSFIHSYSGVGSGSADNPLIRDVQLFSGCGTVGSPWESNPYFNVDDGTSCSFITIHATIALGAFSDPNNPGAYPDCIRVTASPGGPMNYVGGNAWEASFTPAVASGRNVVNITTQYKKPSANNCNQLNPGGNFPKVAVPYVADDDSGPLQYVRLENHTNGGFANSLNGNGQPTSVGVTVGFTPPLKDPVTWTEPPIPLRFWDTSSQSQGLDCANGASGWNTAMQFGCEDPYQIYDQAKHVSACGPPPSGVPAADPPDCIDSENGNFQQNKFNAIFDCATTPNNWNRDPVNPKPPDNDPRWIPLFIVDELAFQQSGKKTYPIRRFGMFYVTAASGLNCPGDVPFPAPSGKRSVFGHFYTEVTPGFGQTIPDPRLCSFTTGSLCVSGLVE